MAERVPRLAALAVLVVLSGIAGAADDPRFPVLAGEGLDEGRSVWLGTCVNCHATGFADAPPVTRYAAWEARIGQPRQVLYAHALDGFYGDDYAHMPPRGGNPSLTDHEVMRAVDYMLALVTFLNTEKYDDTGTD